MDRLVRAMTSDDETRAGILAAASQDDDAHVQAHLASRGER